jgi:hypothetical protein
VIPIHVDKDWNIITHTIMPLIWNPSLGPDTRRRAASGTSTHRVSFSSQSGSLDRGAEPIADSANSNAELGNKNWGLGPSVVVLHLERATRGSTARWSTTSGR